MIKKGIHIVGLVVQLLAILNVNANQQYFSSKSLTIEQGLLSNKNKVIFQDSKGFIWFGSINGLSRYDGHSFSHFEYQPHNPNCLSNSNIEDIAEDKEGNLYIGTNNGLNKFQLSNQQFSYFPLSRNNTQTGAKINELIIDKQNNLCIGSSIGLFIYSLSKQQFIDSIKSPYVNDEVYELCVDRHNSLWVGTGQNVYRYTFTDSMQINLDTALFSDGEFNQVNCIKDIGYGVWVSTNRGNYLFSYSGEIGRKLNVINNKSDITIGNVTDVYLHTDSTLWIGTTNGLYYIEKIAFIDSKDATVQLKASNYKAYYSVGSIFSDYDGNLWVNSTKEGILLLYPSNVNAFKFHHYIEENVNSLGSSYITSIVADNHNNVYLGTDGGGLNGYNASTLEYTRFNNQIEDFENVGVSVMSTCIDKKGTLWFGTYNKSLYSYSTRQDLKDHSSLLKPYNLAGNYSINALCAFNESVIVGTGGHGIFVVNEWNEKAENFNKQTAGLSSDYISCLYVDSRNTLWIGTYWGLNLFDIESRTNKQFLYNKGDVNSLSNNAITSINEDLEGNIWVCTQYGLNKFNAADSTFSTVTKAKGLPSNIVCAVEPDDDHNLWISTQRGLCRMNLENFKVENFELQDQKNIVEFAPSASARSRNGTLYFGSNNGMVQFHPDSLLVFNKNDKIIITDITLFNQSILVNNSIISKAEDSNLQLTLRHHQKVLTIEYAALNFVDPDLDEYAYFLEGFDDDWQEVGNKRTVTYTNLKEGKYTFKVKKLNQENNLPAILKVIILPPIWKTWYALLLYFLLLGTLLWLYQRYSIIKINVKNDLLIQKIQRKKDQEINEMKLRFFTNISHEFCTPLTLIIAPLEQLKAEDQSNKVYDLILKNAHRLLRLINQLMEFRMIETDTLQLNKQNSDLNAFTFEVFQAFNDLAQKNTIDYQFKSEKEQVVVAFDKDKMEKILYNLISNAFKYTPKEGEIFVQVLFKGAAVELQIKDSGIGISDDNLPFIFDRFYNTKSSQTEKKLKEYSSFGVGLSLTKRLVELHNGTIQVESKLNIGTTFSLTLPIEGSMEIPFPLGEIKGVEPLSEKVKRNVNYDFYEHQRTTKASDGDDAVDKQTVLLVEDNHDIRAFLCDLLADRYNVMEAENGKEGIELAIKHDPDLIISDVIMPVMDGVKFCKNIKTDINTSHIPILMVSALHAKEQVIKGLKSGANDFITKPFDPEVLNTKIENILNTQIRFREKFRNDIVIQPSELTTNTKDEALLKQAIEIIEANFTNESFNVEILANQLNLTAISLYRKLKKIVGLSTNEFIRSIRLKKAASHLKADASITINEISFMVGFNDVQYFRKSFKKEFGINPNEYRKQNNKSS